MRLILAVVLLAAAVGWVEAARWKEDGCKAFLTEVAAVKTEGCAGWEHLSIGGLQYLAAANFWNGFSPDMSASSALFRVSLFKKDEEKEQAEERDEGALELTRAQLMRSKGAHGFDYFEVPGGDKLLVLPNYYGCGSGPNLQQDCNSTQVLKWCNAHSEFRELQSLNTQGPGQTDHFKRGEDVYLVVGENFANQVTIHKWNGKTGEFELDQSLPCPGAGATAVAAIDGDVFLVAASYHDPVRGWSTKSPVYRWKKGGKGFEKSQDIPGFGVHDAEHIEFKDDHFLFLSEDRNEKTSKISSQALTFDRKSKKFVKFQSVATDGAHAAELFVSGGGQMFLAVANFGDRHGKRYDSKSTLWRFDEGRGRFGEFVKVSVVPTVGATDWEHFVLEGKDYLAVSNEGDLGKRVLQNSYVYRLDIECSGKKAEL